MEIIEQFVKGKFNSEEKCEDGIFISRDYIAVIDGVTSKISEFLKNDIRTPGKIALELIKQSLNTLNPKADMNEMLNHINKNFINWYKTNNLFEEAKTDGTMRISACTIIYSAFRNQLWVIGDCQAIVDNKRYNFDSNIEKITTELRAMIIQTLLAQGKTEEELMVHDEARDMILPVIASQVWLQNGFKPGPYSYNVLNGFEIATKDYICIQLKENADEIILSSDGYPYLENTLNKTESKLSELLKKDPLLYKNFKATKGLEKGKISFDDRSYIRFSVKKR